ncbi:NAD(P)-dependent oxidoreductase [Herbaspirillum sp. ST 5-3]|uniref:NAD-dependent epimerase/dehydratase family protein n=1 Tax=Oxalobacteraceae TaxID=75682 RepID=UPI0010A50C3D|nr:NAD(P)-dependent oxidoreductase [Herbaspirillum sp. ST 5-3]
MKRVLLTGATGFIGGHVLPRLVASGYEVHAVSTKAPRQTQGVVWHQTDLLDTVASAHLMETIRPTHLLHLAWYAEPGKFWRSLENYRWLEASIALLRSFREQGGERAVMAGTCAEYDWDYGFCSETVTPKRPATPYGVCKNALQEALSSFSGETGMNSAWGRIFFLYGPGENPSRLVASVVGALLRGETARCTHGSQIRDFLHVDDVADAFAALLASDVRGAINIASGQARTLREIVNFAADCIGARDKVNFGAIPAPDNEPPLLVADVRRLSTELNWKPRLDLQAGMAQTVKYWQGKGEK